MTMQEVEGSLVYITHVVDDQKTLLALTTRDDLEFDPSEDNESTSLSTTRGAKRYRTHNEPTLEVGSLLAVDVSALEEIGLVDTEGQLSTAPGSRRLEGELQLEYYQGESGTEGELTHQFGDVESHNLAIDASSTPPVTSWTFQIHGSCRLNTPPDLVVG